MITQALRDYALIGNSRAAALVDRNGSIDWCCLPDFNSPAIFARLLGDNGGFFQISPTDRFNSVQEYAPDTNVVTTIFKTINGTAILSDAFSVMTEEEKTDNLFPDHEILRIVEGISGVIRLQLKFVPRIFYGRDIPRLTDRENNGVYFSWKEHVYILTSSLARETIQVSTSKGTATATFVLKAGQKVIFSLAYSNQSPAIIPEVTISGAERMSGTIRYWRNWINQCKYNGLYREAVRRSALVLKLLTHAPSGAIVAAPTSSLPEELQGERNWDYRYCWLRDASFTTRALAKLGYYEEMNAYLNWILHATQLTRPKLRIAYSVYGAAKLKEQCLSWLPGYHHSHPVRIGNAAYDQFQLDVYGEVIDAIYTYDSITNYMDRSTQKFILGLGSVVCDSWNKPDNGIWEIRSAAKHHTHSKVMAWVALDRLSKLSKKYGWKKTAYEQYDGIAATIQSNIENYGYNERIGSYTGELGTDHLDASLLVLPLIGYCEAATPRMKSTVRVLSAALSENNLIYRYRHMDDSLNGSEGAFAICNFWLAESLVKAGDIQRGIAYFEAVLQHAGPAGLLSEEIEPGTGELLGNYPQGFTHIGLINAAITIEEQYKSRRK